MNNLLPHLLMALASALRTATCLLLLSRLVGNQSSDFKSPLQATGSASSAVQNQKSIITIPVFLGAGAAFLLRLLLSFFPLSELALSGVEVACVVPYAVLLWKKDLRLSLFIAIFGEIAFWLWNILSSCGLGSFTGDGRFLEPASLQGSMAALVPAFLMLSGTILLPLRWPSCNKHAYRIFTILLMLTMFGVIGLQNLEPYRPEEEQYSTCIFLSALLLLSLLIYQLRNLYETEHELAELKDQQAEMITREYNTLQNAYSMNARLFHDFRNHLGALRSLLQTEQYEEAMRYVEDLAGPDTLSKTSWTGDEVIDYLISNKADVAKSLEIQFTAQVEFPKNTKLRSADLCSILGNLLDNAIEAAQKVPTPSGRFISLTIRRINHMILIRVENSFEKAPVTEGGTLRTTKTEGGLHGFGVKSARAAAEKYDGTLQTSFEGNVFRAVATLSLP